MSEPIETVLQSIPRLSSARHKRYKAAVACATCRRRKVKCDGARPVCSRCKEESELRGKCTYIAATEAWLSSPRAAERPVNRGPPASAASGGEAAQETHIQPSDESRPRPFACKVRAAINAQAGLVDYDTPLTPLLDAPLFGSLSADLAKRLRQQSDSASSQNYDLLPPRRHADHLVNFYWLHIESIEPVLDRERFNRSYQALYNGGDLCNVHDERIFASTLNVILALATQLQETVASEQRNRESSEFFFRAWSLLNPEAIIWGPGSIEKVQCLIQMSRFLQATDCTHETYMVLGSAVRMAQNLELHLPRAASEGTHCFEQRRQLWHQCVSLERGISWSAGKPLPLYLMTGRPSPQSNTGGNGSSNSSALLSGVSDALIRVDEMMGHVLLAETLSDKDFGAAVGLHRSPCKWDASAALHLEDRLAELSSSVEHEIASHNPDDIAERRIRLFRLRLAHTRLLLFRPMLARFCLASNQKSTEEVSLHGNVLKACASLCVENTAKLLSLIHEAYTAHPTLLPWWQRVFYLFIVTQHLLAAMLRPDVFAPKVDELWSMASTAFSAHEHLSPVVNRCSSNFTKLVQRIRNVQNGSDFTDLGTLMAGMHEEDFFQDFFQQFGFDLEGRFIDFQDNTAWQAGWNV